MRSLWWSESDHYYEIASNVISHRRFITNAFHFLMAWHKEVKDYCHIIWRNESTNLQLFLLFVGFFVLCKLMKKSQAKEEWTHYSWKNGKRKSIASIIIIIDVIFCLWKAIFVWNIGYLVIICKYRDFMRVYGPPIVDCFVENSLKFCSISDSTSIIKNLLVVTLISSVNTDEYVGEYGNKVSF